MPMLPRLKRVLITLTNKGAFTTNNRGVSDNHDRERFTMRIPIGTTLFYSNLEVVEISQWANGLNIIQDCKDLMMT